MENEMGCIAAAEAGRHLAILGSCALAHTNPNKEKHYYIAHKAKLTALSNNHNDKGPLRAVSHTKDFNKRLGKARSTLYQHLEPVFDLDVDYHVIKEKVFLKLYKDKAVEQMNFTGNPYENSFDLNNINISNHELNAQLGPLTPAHCIGHFDTIPCLPVAVLMHALSRSAGMLLANICHPEISYRVIEATIHAENLAFAGDLVNICAEKISNNDNLYFFRCVASSESGINYGYMDLTLSIANN
jgi:hypothetical protein